jgi:hypothetical protein
MQSTIVSSSSLDRIALARPPKEWCTAAGYTGPERTEQIVESKLPPNRICTLPGASDEIALVSAHFDDVDRGEGDDVLASHTGKSTAK